MNNVKMYQGHREAVRGIRFVLCRELEVQRSPSRGIKTFEGAYDRNIRK